MRAGRPSHPGQDAQVIGWYTHRENQKELLNTLTERKDGEIIASILGKDQRLPKQTN